LGVIQRRFSDFLDYFLEKFYSPFLETCLRWRYTVLFTFVSGLLICFALMGAGWIKVVFFSTIEGDTASATVTFAQNSSPQTVRAGIDKIEDAALQLKREYKEETGVD